MFLSILAHHKKNCVVKFNHQRSGQTVSHYVHVDLLYVLKMHIGLLSSQVPHQMIAQILDRSGLRYHGCLWAIDDTHEGSTSDARVLRDSISRVHGLKVSIAKVLFDNTEGEQDDSAEIPDVISTIESND
ncbi:hypothetical protein ACS0TY_010390 [Phlomoides rotata]